MTTSSNHWSRMAANWRLVGPPLRPGAADQALFDEVIAGWSSPDGATPRALILGVTPELFHLGWPPGTQISALDGSPEMIAAVWPGEKSRAITGSWTASPLDDASQDIILLDGGFGVLGYPDAQLALLTEIRRILAPNGVFAVRLFAPAGRTGTLADISADLKAGSIASLDGLKLRLWGALQRTITKGVCPAEVVAQIEAMTGELAWLASTLGWSAQHLDTLELHRHSTATYHLIDEQQLLQMAQGLTGLCPLSVTFPQQPYGACCPVVSLRRC